MPVLSRGSHLNFPLLLVDRLSTNAVDDHDCAKNTISENICVHKLDSNLASAILLRAFDPTMCTTSTMIYIDLHYYRTYMNLRTNEGYRRLNDDPHDEPSPST